MAGGLCPKTLQSYKISTNYANIFILKFRSVHPFGKLRPAGIQARRDTAYEETETFGDS